MKTMDAMKYFLDESDNEYIKAIIPLLLEKFGKWVDIKEKLPQLHEESSVEWFEDADADYEERAWDTWESDEVIAKTSKGHILLSSWNKWVKQDNGKTEYWWMEEPLSDPIIAWWTPYEEYIKEESIQIDRD